VPAARGERSGVLTVFDDGGRQHGTSTPEVSVLPSGGDALELRELEAPGPAAEPPEGGRVVLAEERADRFRTGSRTWASES